MNNELIKIRKVLPEDALKWFTLKNEVWRDAYNHIFPEEVFIEKENTINKQIENFTNKIKNNDENIAYVAEYKGELIGLMYGSITSSYQYFFSEYADLIALYIDPKFQSNGIGTSFKKIFENWARKNGASKYVIGVLKDNIKARKVYESWGGKLSEHKENFVKLDVKYPEVFYLYDL